MGRRTGEGGGRDGRREKRWTLCLVLLRRLFLLRFSRFSFRSVSLAVSHHEEWKERRKQRRSLLSPLPSTPLPPSLASFSPLLLQFRVRVVAQRYVSSFFILSELRQPSPCPPSFSLDSLTSSSPFNSLVVTTPLHTAQTVATKLPCAHIPPPQPSDLPPPPLLPSRPLFAFCSSVYLDTQ
jgi:hypothetical protein